MIAAPRPWPGIGATAMRGCGAGVGVVEQVEQARRGFDEIAGGAERDVARDRAEADQTFAVAAAVASRRSGLAGA